MTKYSYKVKYSKQFKNNLKKIEKQGKDIERILMPVIEKLANKERLADTYNNHKLKDNKFFKDCWECHLGNKRSDWLLIYKYDDDSLILFMINTGSHSELFSK